MEYFGTSLNKIPLGSGCQRGTLFKEWCNNAILHAGKYVQLQLLKIYHNVADVPYNILSNKTMCIIINSMDLYHSCSAKYDFTVTIIAILW